MQVVTLTTSDRYDALYRMARIPPQNPLTSEADVVFTYGAATPWLRPIAAG